jgi:hypothetical protein
MGTTQDQQKISCESKKRNYNFANNNHKLSWRNWSTVDEDKTSLLLQKSSQAWC